MSKKKEETLNGGDVIVIAFVVLILLFAMILFARTITITNISYDEYCKQRYGENHTYKIIKEFGEYCVELNYENLSYHGKARFNLKEAKEYCDMPKFLELNKWGNNCLRETRL